jgi:hypothetical protein
MDRAARFHIGLFNSNILILIATLIWFEHFKLAILKEILPTISLRSRDSVVGIATGYGLDD